MVKNCVLDSFDRSSEEWRRYGYIVFKCRGYFLLIYIGIVWYVIKIMIFLKYYGYFDFLVYIC